MEKIDAGEYSDWVNSFILTMKGKGVGEVPCGDCVGCCTSSKFILVRPTDSEARSVIPNELLFSAPSLPEGFHLLGYDGQGHCPMFVNGKCSIYHSRPETCRQYDCRVLAATEASIEDENTAVAERVKSWQFSYKSVKSSEEAESIKRSMAFLKEHTENFPMGYLPNSDSQLAALAIRFYKEFTEPVEQDVDEKVRDIISKYP